MCWCVLTTCDCPWWQVHPNITHSSSRPSPMMLSCFRSFHLLSIFKSSIFTLPLHNVRAIKGNSNLLFSNFQSKSVIHKGHSSKNNFHFYVRSFGQRRCITAFWCTAWGSVALHITPLSNSDWISSSGKKFINNYWCAPHHTQCPGVCWQEALAPVMVGTSLHFLTFKSFNDYFPNHSRVYSSCHST
jgi:hypothetical protein